MWQSQLSPFLGPGDGWVPWRSPCRAGRLCQWTVLDPSGRLAALCRLPHLGAVSKTVDLHYASPGALCAYRVIAEPRREDYFGDLAGSETGHLPMACR